VRRHTAASAACCAPPPSFANPFYRLNKQRNLQTTGNQKISYLCAPGRGGIFVFWPPRPPSVAGGGVRITWQTPICSENLPQTWTRCSEKFC